MDPVVEARPGITLVAVRRRWPWIVAVVLLGMLGGYVVSQQLPTTYTSTAVAFLNPLPGNPFSPTTSVARNDQLAALETEASLLQTTRLGDHAEEVAKGALPPEPESQLAVTVPSNSQVLRITYTGDTPDEARLGAQSFADAFLAYRQTNAQNEAAEQVKRLQAQFDTMQELLSSASSELADVDPDSAVAAQLEQQVQTYASTIAQLNVEISGITGSSQNPGQVISPASVPAAADGFSPWFVVGAGILGALALAIAGAVWREHSDDRLRDPLDIAALGAGHVMATLPVSRPTMNEKGHRRPPAAGRGGRGAREVEEGFRVLRTAVLSNLTDPQSVVAVSAVSRRVDGVGVAVGLAQAVERSGRRVVLVLADAQGAAPQPPGPGLSDLLRESPMAAEEAVSDVLHEVETGLLVLRPGSAPLDSDDLVSSNALRALLDRLRTRADLVVIAAPMAASATGQALAMASDAVVLVAEYGRTTHDDLLSASEALTDRHVRVLGVAAVAHQRGGAGAESAPLWPFQTLAPSMETGDEPAARAAAAEVAEPPRKITLSEPPGPDAESSSPQEGAIPSDTDDDVADLHDDVIEKTGTEPTDTEWEFADLERNSIFERMSLAYDAAETDGIRAVAEGHLAMRHASGPAGSADQDPAPSTQGTTERT